MKIGKFSIELINAETKVPMKEFTAPDGKVYVEAEPDLEYFIRCHRERSFSYAVSSDTTVELRVDDAFLGYQQPFGLKTGDMGLWKSQNGVGTMCALKLILKKRTRGADSSLSNTTPPIGRVKATFYEYFQYNDMVPLEDVDNTNCLNQSSTSAPTVASGAKKAFASVSGSTTVSVTTSKWCKRAVRGRCLGEMTIHYTSALGLSQLGILAPIVPTQNYEDVSVITEPKRKRVKTEPRVVSPSYPRSNNKLIDLTGDD